MNCVANLFHQQVLICVLDSLVPKMKENTASLFHLINSVPRNLVASFKLAFTLGLFLKTLLARYFLFLF